MAEEKPVKGKPEMVSNHLEKDAYNPAFVAQVLKGVKAKENGEPGRRVDVDNLWGEKPEIESEKLPAHVLKSIEIGLKQVQDGHGISREEFKERHFTKK